MQTNKLITYSSQIQKIVWNLLSSVIKQFISETGIWLLSSSFLYIDIWLLCSSFCTQEYRCRSRPFSCSTSRKRHHTQPCKLEWSYFIPHCVHQHARSNDMFLIFIWNLTLMLYIVWVAVLCKCNFNFVFFPLSTLKLPFLSQHPIYRHNLRPLPLPSVVPDKWNFTV
jgi:hypothetical protein